MDKSRLEKIVEERDRLYDVMIRTLCNPEATKPVYVQAQKDYYDYIKENADALSNGVHCL